ncbi:MAG: diguanylate cyclase and metal dependent phosphohydrolase [Conexibacter sp.]|nr:diguanylate cyclase and metal dependent phosphohydrolase [Conexibacter sp.]
MRLPRLPPRPAGRTRGARRAAALAWAPVLVAILLAVATGWTISALRGQADRARRVEVSIAQIHVDLEVPQGLLDQAAYGAPSKPPPVTGATPGAGAAPAPLPPPPPPPPRGTVAATAATVLPRLNAIHDDASEPQRVDAIVAGLRALASTLETSPVGSPQRTQLMQRVELAFGALEHDQAHEAVTTARTADVATLLLIGVGALAVVLLLRRFDRVRRRDYERHTAELRELTLQDPLTRLANRRRLEQDLATATAGASSDDPVVFVMFDLDGFKGYNDTFGHHGGDLLLQRLSHKLQHAALPHGTAYRLGGDEFCALLPKAAGPDAAAACREALSERGEGYAITASAGAVTIPDDAADPSGALQLADERMYAQKPPRAGAARGWPDAAASRRGGSRVDGPEVDGSAVSVAEVAEVAALVAEVGAGVGLGGAPLRDLVLAAELREGPLLRAIHERFDGSGHPHALAGEEIPLGGRVLHACDAFDAMTSPRPYRTVPLTPQEALAELRRCAGTQFDPHVVDVIEDVLGSRLVSSPIA